MNKFAMVLLLSAFCTFMSVKSVAYVGNVAEFENSSSKPEENIVDISTLGML